MEKELLKYVVLREILSAKVSILSPQQLIINFSRKGNSFCVKSKERSGELNLLQH